MGAMNYVSITPTQMEEVEKKLPVLFERGDTKTFFNMIEKKEVKKVSDKAFRIPLEIAPGGYFGTYNPDGGDMGRGSGPAFKEATIQTFHFKFALEWTHKAEITTDDSRKAVVNAFKHIVAKAMPDFRRHMAALAMTDGTGVLGTVASKTTGSSVDTVVLTGTFGAKLLRKGQKVTVYDSTMTTHRTSGGEVEITYVDLPNQVIKFAEVSGLTAGDLICLSGFSGSNPTSVYGLPYHHNNSTVGSWLGMTRADYPEVLCNAVNAGGDFNLSAARLARNLIGDRLGMDGIPKLVAKCHPCQAQAYEDQARMVSTIQKTSGSEALNLYFGEAMQLAGSPLEPDYFWARIGLTSLIRMLGVAWKWNRSVSILMRMVISSLPFVRVMVVLLRRTCSILFRRLISIITILVPVPTFITSRFLKVTLSN